MPTVAAAPAPRPRGRPRLAALAAGLLVLALGAAPARAAITVYTDLTAFLAAIQPGSYTEAFSGLPANGITFTSPRAFSGGGYGFEAAASASFFASTEIAGDKGFSVFLGSATLILRNLTGPGPVTAIGGFFFTVTATGDAVAPLGALSVTATAGATSRSQAVAAPTSTTGFVGFISDSDPFSSLAVVRTTGTGSGFAAVDDVILGARAVPARVPEPASAALIGAGLLGLTVIRRRKRRPAG